MKAIIIDAEKREVRETDISGDLKSLQAAVGGYIELVRLDDANDLYVNEEGLLHGEQNFFEYQGAHQPFAGNGVIIGVTQEGATAPATISAEAVRGRVVFISRANLARRFAGGE